MTTSAPQLRIAILLGIAAAIATALLFPYVLALQPGAMALASAAMRLPAWGVVVAQSSVDWQHRGVATSTNMFARSMGSAVGVAVFGAIVNASVSGSAGASPDLERLSPGVLAPAIHPVFVVSAFIALALVLSALLMPRGAGAADTEG